MRADEHDGLPRTGETGRTLGARPGGVPDGDIPVDTRAIVYPDTGGISVSLPPENLRVTDARPEFGGSDAKLIVYEIETDEQSCTPSVCSPLSGACVPWT